MCIRDRTVATNSTVATFVRPDNGLRPVTPEGKAYANGKFPNVKFFRIADLGGWAETDKKFFGKGGVWDQIFAQTR